METQTQAKLELTPPPPSSADERRTYYLTPYEADCVRYVVDTALNQARYQRRVAREEGRELADKATRFRLHSTQDDIRFCNGVHAAAHILAPCATIDPKTHTTRNEERGRRMQDDADQRDYIALELTAMQADYLGGLVTEFAWAYEENPGHPHRSFWARVPELLQDVADTLSTLIDAYLLKHGYISDATVSTETPQGYTFSCVAMHMHDTNSGEYVDLLPATALDRYDCLFSMAEMEAVCHALTLAMAQMECVQAKAEQEGRTVNQADAFIPLDIFVDKDAAALLSAAFAESPRRDPLRIYALRDHIRQGLPGRPYHLVCLGGREYSVLDEYLSRLRPVLLGKQTSTGESVSLYARVPLDAFISLHNALHAACVRAIEVVNQDPAPLADVVNA